MPMISRAAAQLHIREDPVIGRPGALQGRRAPFNQPSNGSQCEGERGSAGKGGWPTCFSADAEYDVDVSLVSG